MFIIVLEKGNVLEYLVNPFEDRYSLFFNSPTLEGWGDWSVTRWSTLYNDLINLGYKIIKMYPYNKKLAV